MGSPSSPSGVSERRFQTGCNRCQRVTVQGRFRRRAASRATSAALIAPIQFAQLQSGISSRIAPPLMRAICLIATHTKRPSLSPRPKLTRSCAGGNVATRPFSFSEAHPLYLAICSVAFPLPYGLFYTSQAPPRRYPAKYGPLLKLLRSNFGTTRAPKAPRSSTAAPRPNFQTLLL